MASQQPYSHPGPPQDHIQKTDFMYTIFLAIIVEIYSLNNFMYNLTAINT